MKEYQGVHVFVMSATPGPLDESCTLSARALRDLPFEEAAVCLCLPPFLILLSFTSRISSQLVTIKQNSSLGNRPLGPVRRKINKKIRVLKDSREVNYKIIIDKKYDHDLASRTLSTHSSMRGCLCCRKKMKNNNRGEKLSISRLWSIYKCNSQVQRVMSKSRVRERQVVRIIIMRKAKKNKV
jgi:hypothetical protein